MAIHHEHVVGVFDSRVEAERVIHELRDAGFAESDIGYAIRHTGAPGETPAPSGTGGTGGTASTAGTAGATDLLEPETAAGGAATGALTGGLLGGLLGAAAALLVPGIGPVLAGGILASALGGAAIGAAAGGLLGALVGIGVPEDDATFYEHQFHAGRAVVTVRADARAAAAREIMRRHGAYDRTAPGTAAAAPPEGGSPIPRAPETHAAQAAIDLPPQTNPR